MRIVHVMDSFRPRNGAGDGALVGPVAALAQQQRGQQRGQGHDVRIVTLTPDHHGSSQDEDHDFAVARSTVSRARALVSVPWLRTVAVACVTADPDIVHAHFAVCSPLAITAARAANRREVPLAVTVHSMWPAKAMLRAANLSYWNAPVRAAWSSVSTVGATSVRRCLKHDTDVMVVPDFVDTEWWTRAPTPVRRGDVQLVTVASQGTSRLLDAIAAVRARSGPAAPVRLSIVDDPAHRDPAHRKDAHRKDAHRKDAHRKDAHRNDRHGMDRHPKHHHLEPQIVDLGLSSSVSLLGALTRAELRNALHSADVYVASAPREPFGTTALQARSSGLQVIGFRGTGLSDFIDDGREGALVADNIELTHTLAALTRPVSNRTFLPRRLPTTPSTAASAHSFVGCP